MGGEGSGAEAGIPRIHGDGHVHLHPGHDAARLLRAALTVARGLGEPLVLLLAERAGVDAFGELQQTVGTPGPRRERGLEIAATAETRSLALAEPGAAPSVFVVAGRQIVSREGIEVLALGVEPASAAARLADRSERAADLLRFGLAAGAAAVLPWGFGKWLGTRGREVARLAAEPALAAEPLFFLGDIAARAWPWPTPAAFRTGRRVLPGTDILPEPGAEERVASYRFSVPGRIDAERPAASLLGLLADPAAGIRAEGRRQRLPRALASQLRLRLRGNRGDAPLRSRAPA
jgi:hypothetical protein